MKLRHLVLLAPFAAGMLWAASSADGLVLPERVLPALDPILRTAAQQSPRMVNRALELEIAENNRIQARANLLPSVGGAFRIYETRDDREDIGDVRAQKTYYDLSITQPLFHWGERMNNARIGEIQKQMAERNYSEAYRGLLQELRMKYLQLIVQKQGVQRAREALAYANQQVRLGEERLAKKVISELEMYPIRLAAEQGQITLERTEFDFAMAKASFARLSGTSAPSDHQIPDAVPTLTYDAQPIDRLLAGFLSRPELPTPEAVNARFQRQIEELNYKNQKTRLRPKVSAVAGSNQDQQSYTINTAQKYRVTSLYAGVSVSWTIFDGFAAQAATRNALARLRQVEGDEKELLHRLGQQAQTQAKHVNFAARAMAISDRALVSAEGNLRTKQGEFQRGIVSESDVTLAGLHLIDARINAFNHRIDYLSKVGEFLGTLAADPAVANLSAP